MFGAICGDIIGVPFEFNATKDKNFVMYQRGKHKPPTFSDDTVLTIAVADSLMNDTDLVENFHKYVNQERRRGYGGRFGRWISNGEREPYNSFGNGSAMRVSPVGWFYDNVKDVLKGAKATADVTHNHPEGIKGAQAVALAVYMARKGSTKQAIKKEIAKRFGYDMNRTCDEIRVFYSFDVTCQGSVPEAILAFIESTDYDDAVRNAVALGGDTDTQACMAGAIAEAFYGGVPKHHVDFAKKELPANFLKVVEDFNRKYVQPKKKA